MPDNLFRRIVAERHWSYEAFLNQFELAAVAVAEPRLRRCGPAPAGALLIEIILPKAGA